MESSRKWFLILLLILIPVASPAAEAQWATVTQSVPIAQVSPEEARTMALRHARVRAIEQICGVSLQSETLVRQAMTSGQYVQTTAYGHVRNEMILREGFRIVPGSADAHPTCGPSANNVGIQVEQREPREPMRLYYYVEVRIEVQPESGAADPTFQVKLDLDRRTYETGDELSAKIRATKDCYLTVLNITADDQVHLIMPTPSLPKNLLKRGAVFQLPDPDLAELRVAPLPGHEQDEEFLVVIATLERMDLLLGEQFSLMDLSRWLASIPPEQRAQDQAAYLIKAKVK